jgi:thiol:disulfide interchange protein DsbC
MLIGVALGFSMILAGTALQAADATPESGAVPERPSTQRLQDLVPGATLGEPQPTPVDGIFRVGIDGNDLYLTADGLHAFTGDLLDLATGQNLTEMRRNADRLAALDGLPEDALLVLPAKGEERARVHVFTDSTCPYCQKLHRETSELRNTGVTVAYIPFPRAGLQGPGYQELRTIWCAEDRAAAFDIATGDAPGTLPADAGDCPAAAAVDAGYRLGEAMAVRGTPTIVLPDGGLLPGYVEPRALLKRLWRE